MILEFPPPASRADTRAAAENIARGHPERSPEFCRRAAADIPLDPEAAGHRALVVPAVG